MPSDPSFVAHAVELVSLLGPVTARSMFGGHGLYAGDVMFGLLDDDELFLKADAETRERFLAAGCRQWIYVTGKVRMENTGYFRPPDAAHDDPETMLPWARLALDAALRVRAEKAAKARRKAGAKAKPAARAKAASAVRAGAQPKAAQPKAKARSRGGAAPRRRPGPKRATRRRRTR